MLREEEEEEVRAEDITAQDKIRRPIAQDEKQARETEEEEEEVVEEGMTVMRERGRGRRGGAAATGAA